MMATHHRDVRKIDPSQGAMLADNTPNDANRIESVAQDRGRDNKSLFITPIYQKMRLDWSNFGNWTNLVSLRL